MMNRKIVLLVIVWCCVFESVCPTLILFNALKNTVSNTRCKLHKIGSKIISHDHKLGDPCEASGKHEEHDDNYQPTEQTYAKPDHNKGEINEPKENQQSSESGVEHQNGAVTTENHPNSLDIDVRLGSDDQTTSKYSTTTRKYATVPHGGGKRIFKAPCKDGLETTDGCLEEI